MSFDRYRAQVFFEETIAGCATREEFFLKAWNEIQGITLNNTNAFTLKTHLQEDAKDLYYKGCVSLSESLTGFSQKHYSWAIVKGYYATFYFLKADFALRNYAIIRCKNGKLFYIKTADGEIPINKNYTGDHKFTLGCYKELFLTSDILLSQNIENENCYDWLMKKRERINYQERNFYEPNCLDFLTTIDSRIEQGEMQKIIDDIINDNTPIYPFIPEYATIAIPLKRAILTKENFNDNGIINIVNQDQTNHIQSFSFNFI